MKENIMKRAKQKYSFGLYLLQDSKPQIDNIIYREFAAHWHYASFSKLLSNKSDGQSYNLYLKTTFVLITLEHMICVIVIFYSILQY